MSLWKVSPILLTNTKKLQVKTISDIIKKNAERMSITSGKIPKVQIGRKKPFTFLRADCMFSMFPMFLRSSFSSIMHFNTQQLSISTISKSGNLKRNGLNRSTQLLCFCFCLTFSRKLFFLLIFHFRSLVQINGVISLELGVVG